MLDQDNAKKNNVPPFAPPEVHSDTSTTVNTVHSTTSKPLFHSLFDNSPSTTVNHYTIGNPLSHSLFDNSPSPRDQRNHIPTKKSQLDILETSACSYILYPQTTSKK